jgi:hypothetical protein
MTKRGKLFVGAGFIGMLATTLALQWAYSHQPVWEGTSPDGRYRLEVRTRRTFLTFDILDVLDPPGTAFFIVIDRSAERTIATARVPLDEIFDFQTPHLVWTSKQVEVVNFDESHPGAAVRLLWSQ